jgi:hypothetical protein
MVDEETRDQLQEHAGSMLEYDLKDGKFTAFYRYPDEVDVEAFDIDPGHGEAALRARNGDKPVFYPPLPKGAFGLKS